MIIIIVGGQYKPKKVQMFLGFYTLKQCTLFGAYFDPPIIIIVNLVHTSFVQHCVLCFPFLNAMSC